MAKLGLAIDPEKAKVSHYVLESEWIKIYEWQNILD